MDEERGALCIRRLSFNTHTAMEPPEQVFEDSVLEEIEQNFPKLNGNKRNNVYLDNAGAALYGREQLKAVFDDLSSNIYSNPHSCAKTKAEVDRARDTVLEHFGTSPEEYSVIFTSGATGAIRLIGETSMVGRSLVYVDECHTSVVGLRELAEGWKCLSREEFLSKEVLDGLDKPVVLAFPAMSNFCGSKFPLSRIDEIKERSSDSCLILLDAASFVSTSHLDLSRHKPDFVCVSFYKMFGYPTGLGALIVRNGDAAESLRSSKRYFGGGTVAMSLVRKGVNKPRESLHDSLEDGTLPFLDIVSLRHGFSLLKRLSMTMIQGHTFALAKYLYGSLKRLKHDNGGSLVEVYSRTDFDDPESQGPIVNFNLLQSDGSHFGFLAFKRLAEQENVVVRTGCFCNVGACQRYLGFTDDDTMDNFLNGHVCGDDVDLGSDGRPIGSIRISFGYYSKKEDADVVIEILRKYFLNVSQNPLAVVRDPGTAKISGIFVYPVKSCAPMAVEESEIGPTGFKYDRHWAIMKGSKCLSQKDLKTLCLVRPKIEAGQKVLTLSFPNMEPLRVPLDLEGSESPSNNEVCVGKVCGVGIDGLDCGQAASDWLEEATGEPDLRLIRLLERRSRNGQRLSLSNAGQYLVLNRSSAEKLCDELDTDWVLGQFRGNIVLDGCPANSEAVWDEIVLGDSVRLRKVRNCTRCGMIRIDQKSGEDTDVLHSELTKRTEKGFSFGVLFDLATESEELGAKIRLGDAARIIGK